MIDKETYEREITRMFDSVRTKNKGRSDCCGVPCSRCPLEGNCRITAWNVFKMIEFVEQWSKEHQPKKLTRFEFEMLKWLDKAGYKFIVRSPWNNLTAHDSTPEKRINGFNGWVSENEYKDLTEFNELFQFIKWADEEPTSIQEVLKNCEVKEDV